MAEYAVNEAWDKRWETMPNFAPVSFDHDTISAITNQVVSRLRRGGTLVDVGSGPGSRTIPLAGPKTNLILLDQSLKALQLAKDYAISKGVEATYVQADAFAIPLADNSVDGTLSNGVNEHFLDPQRQQLFNEMARVVRPGGIVAVAVPNKRNVFHRVNKKAREIRGTWPFGPQYDYTPKELRRRMHDAQLADVQMYGVGAFTSWIRLFPERMQRKLHEKPTPSRRLNQFLWKHDAQITSPINRRFGREIFAIGVKK